MYDNLNKQPPRTPAESPTKAGTAVLYSDSSNTLEWIEEQMRVLENMVMAKLKEDITNAYKKEHLKFIKFCSETMKACDDMEGRIDKMLTEHKELVGKLEEEIIRGDELLAKMKALREDIAK